MLDALAGPCFSPKPEQLTPLQRARCGTTPDGMREWQLPAADSASPTRVPRAARAAGLAAAAVQAVELPEDWLDQVNDESMHALQGLEPGRVRRTVSIIVHSNTKDVPMVVTTTMYMKMRLASQGKQSIAGRANCQSCASYKADYTRQFLTPEKDPRQISPFQHRTLKALRDVRTSGGKSVMAVRVELGKQSANMKVVGVQVPNPTHGALAVELQDALVGLGQLHSFLREPVELAALVEDGTLKPQMQQILLPRVPVEDNARLRLWYARASSGASIDDLHDLYGVPEAEQMRSNLATIKAVHGFASGCL